MFVAEGLETGNFHAIDWLISLHKFSSCWAVFGVLGTQAFALGEPESTLEILR